MPGKVDESPRSDTSRTTGWALRYLGSMVVTLVAAFVILPDLIFELDRRTPFAQLVAFRLILLVGVGLCLRCSCSSPYSSGERCRSPPGWPQGSAKSDDLE